MVVLTHENINRDSNFQVTSLIYGVVLRHRNLPKICIFIIWSNHTIHDINLSFTCKSILSNINHFTLLTPLRNYLKTSTIIGTVGVIISSLAFHVTVVNPGDWDGPLSVDPKNWLTETL